MAKKKAVRRSSKKADTCKQVTSLIVGYLAGELDALTKFALERHLLECPDCVSFLNTYKKTVRAVRSLQYEDVPSDMRLRVRQFLRDKIGDTPQGE